jgi:hypothetical protein
VVERTRNRAADEGYGAEGEFVLIWRGVPIKTGWNSTAAAIVQSSARAIIRPMLGRLTLPCRSITFSIPL